MTLIAAVYDRRRHVAYFEFGASFALGPIVLTTPSGVILRIE